MAFDANKFDRVDPATGRPNLKGSQWVAEAAELGPFETINPRVPPRNFVMRNCPEEGMIRTFSFTHTDESGGDIAGWNYEEDAGPNKGNTSYRNPANPRPCRPFTVLIIND